MRKKRCLQGSNLRGKLPMDFKSIALTTRPKQQVNEGQSILRVYEVGAKERITVNALVPTPALKLSTEDGLLRARGDDMGASHGVVSACSHTDPPLRLVYALCAYCHRPQP